MLPVRWSVVLLAFVAAASSAQTLPAEAQAYLGDWLVADDGSDEAQAVMRIYEDGGRVHGRIVRSLEDGAAAGGAVPCDDCSGEFEGVDLREVPLIRNMKWEGDGFGGGRIYDPRSGRGYKCLLELGDDGQLRVRGYLGVRALGRTQVWARAD